MVKDKELQVSAIENGTVIDHIPDNQLFKVIHVLGLQNIDNLITFGRGYKSSRDGKKGIIKIENKFLDDADVNKLALVAPSAKINIIKDFEVIEKKCVQVPDSIVGIVKCVNPMCITNQEHVTTKFAVVDKENLSLKCHYCEKITDNENIRIVE
ncbi:aspartate carbamoyltransferase regulatory subunit [Marinilabiliaceae bacterium JC040]|nr:aspartate carbamoyltransferase regulatory subunit [Marinilabiliaceae bacterium JC040]